MVKNIKILVILGALGLILLLVPQVLAQAPIKGWDKAEFGMSPEELKKAYKEEDEYFLHKFWMEEEDVRSEVNYYYPPPYPLVTILLEVLGEDLWVEYSFVDNKLFAIEISLLGEVMDWDLERLEDW